MQPIFITGRANSLVVNTQLSYQRSEVQIPTKADRCLEIYAPLAPSSELSYRTSTLTTDCIVKEKTGQRVRIVR